MMGYYKAEWVRTFDFFARNYTICDRSFAALATGTQANRLMAMSGTTSINFRGAATTQMGSAVPALQSSGLASMLTSI